MPVSEAEKAALSKTRGRLAAGISDAGERQNFVREQGDIDAKGGKDIDYAELSSKTRNEENRQALEPTYSQAYKARQE